MKNRVIRRFIILTVLLVLLHPAADAGGSDWIIIDKKADGDTGPYNFYFIARADIQRPSHSILRYRGMTVSVPREGPMPTDDELTKSYAPGDYVELDCSGKKMRTVLPGEESSAPGEAGDWSAIEPDSLHEKTYRVFCGRAR